MTVKERVARGRSMKNVLETAACTGKDPQKFKELLALLHLQDYATLQVAAMVLSKCHDADPQLINGHLPELLNLVQTSREDVVKRNIVRCLQDTSFPENLREKAVNVLFPLMENKQEAVAIRVFTMSTLANICTEIPELAEPLCLLIEDQLLYGSAGFKSRGKKVLARLQPYRRQAT